uniref:non-specific serine/threonine protein kinase n=1 Tax=Quercus lobata TaxID=97700 RepID=A0A7N2R9D9_QUELO
MQVKHSLTDPSRSLASWNDQDDTPCNWTGLKCDTSTRRVISVDLSNFQLEGPFSTFFCRLPSLSNLTLSNNFINSSLPVGISTCQNLKLLNLSQNFIEGPIPGALSRIPNLRVLDLSGNNFSGEIPASFGEFRRLETLNLVNNFLNGSIPISLGNISRLKELGLAYNSFSPSHIPSQLGNLTSLEVLYLSGCNLKGSIPDSLSRLTRLQNLELSYNKLTGSIPNSLTELKSILQIELYQNALSGELPSGLSNLTKLLRFDVSKNELIGTIPDELCGLQLESLKLSENRFEGSLPTNITQSTNLYELTLFNNRLTGSLPSELGKNSSLQILDVSSNGFSGGIPSHLCENGAVTDLILFNNSFSGEIPESLGKCQSLYRVRLTHNNISGTIPRTLVKLSELVTLDLNDNELSGDIPVGIQGWKKLIELNLANNRFSGEIPDEIGSLLVLNYLDLSGNNFSGIIPPELQNLKLNFLNLSNNRLSGDLPPLYANRNYRNSFVGNPGLCGDLPDLCPRVGGSKKHGNFWILLKIFVPAGIVLIVGIVLFCWKYRAVKKNKKEIAVEIAMSPWKEFHKLGFSLSEIMDCIDENNVIGRGASGKVYKAVLSKGETVAVKKLFRGGGENSEKYGFEAEVETLGKIRHRNIMRLWCCYDYLDCKLLVYEYMPNGSLGDLLHRSRRGLLDWPKRYQIALDVAQGLSYLHHDCVPPIIHRDVKSNNILIDGEFGAKVADFGVAKVVAVAGPRGVSMSVIAGSPGYIAPEYVQTRHVNEKSDIYSFGVVILELVTGRLPIDPEFGDEGFIKWVSTTLNQKGIDHVIDPKLESKYKEVISKILDIGLLCTGLLPISRPAMRKVVRLLQGVSADKKSNRVYRDGTGSPYYQGEASDQAGKFSPDYHGEASDEAVLISRTCHTF